MGTLIQIAVGIIIAGLIIAIPKKESTKSLLFVLFFVALISYDLYNVTHHPRNVYLLALAQASGKNYLMAVFDLIANGSKWYTWLVYVIFIPFFGFSYFKNKQKEDAVLNAMLQLIGRGEIKINSKIISNQVNADDYEVIELFNIFKSAGKIPYDVEIYTND